ncbi:MAG: hypothetical protein EXS37_18815 [Opitutus sp.]|nr:hypothetical protein [Opitutus sp.]
MGIAAAQPPSFGPPTGNVDFAIYIVDQETGRGVPLVELRTVSNAAWWTDSAGLVAFDETGLMEREVYCHVQSPGYAYPSDGFGNRGVKLRPVPGGNATIKLRRVNVAERLYRITGEGVYRDSVRLGRPVPTRQPLLNGLVTGQGIVIATPYREKIYWFWGGSRRKRATTLKSHLRRNSYSGVVGLKSLVSSRAILATVSWKGAGWN